jgi:hypothetical protein
MHKSTTKGKAMSAKEVLIGLAGFVGFVLLIFLGASVFFKGPPDELPGFCSVIIYEDGTWVEDGWDPAKEFPPKGCVIAARVN